MRELIQAVENYLAICLTDLSMPPRLRAAMNYSLLAGGKRLRPVLCLLCAGASCPSAERDATLTYALPFACGLEMIHTYSLIHDDLPAMDDDDLRRGRPSNHKAFDEATAILAGDALVTDAFWFMARAGENIAPVRVLRALSVVAEAAGGRGMVGGQVLDIEYTGLGLAPVRHDAALLTKLQAMQALKTGALFRAACIGGGILGGANEESLTALGKYAEALGLAFQIVDDILDETQDTAILGKPAGSDAEKGKLTWPSLTSLDESRERAHLEAEKAAAALKALTGPDADTLRDLALRLVNRIR